MWNVKCCGFDAASQPTYFIVSGSPSNLMLGGGDLNGMLGVIVVLGVNNALQQTVLLSPAPQSPYNPMLREVTEMIFVSDNIRAKSTTISHLIVTFFKKSSVKINSQLL